MELLGMVLVIALSAGSLLLVLWTRRRQTNVNAGLAELYASTYDATVACVDSQPSPIGQGGRALTLLTVYYRCDDGTESHVQAYEKDAMRGSYTGALAYYREAPSFSELSKWQVGDRLHKPATHYFPHRVEQQR